MIHFPKLTEGQGKLWETPKVVAKPTFVDTMYEEADKNQESEFGDMRLKFEGVPVDEEGQDGLDRGTIY